MFKLDNPVWFALSEQHRRHIVELGGGYFYDPLFCPFGAFNDTGKDVEAISAYCRLIEDFYVVGVKPGLPNDVLLQNELICWQMVIEKFLPVDITEEIVLLNVSHEKDLIQLVNKVQPGFFKKKTAALGNYYGIYQDGELVAVTGERMKLDDYTEISAVITHPLFTGKGYAKQLLTFAVNNNLNQQKVVFLHVNKENSGAISLYERIGFVKRRDISFWHLLKSPGQ